MPIGFSLNFTTPEEAVDFTARLLALVVDLNAKLDRIVAEGSRIESRLDLQKPLLQQVLQKIDRAIQAGADPANVALLGGKIENLTECVSAFSDAETKP